MLIIVPADHVEMVVLVRKLLMDTNVLALQDGLEKIVKLVRILN